MRVQIHDFGGYPFVSDLVDRLLMEGHEVDYVYSAQYSGNVGAVTSQQSASRALVVTGLVADAVAEKYRPAGRLRFELAYFRAWLAHTDSSAPDVILCANVPLVVLLGIARRCRRRATPWVLWHQDIVSLAMTHELERRLPRLVARVGGAILSRLERRTAQRASKVVAIGRPFEAVYRAWRLPADRYRIVPNWAPLNEIAPSDRENPWSKRMFDRTDVPRLVYAGTLGRKHRPQLLHDLARQLGVLGVPVDLVVVSEGPAVDELAALTAPAPSTLRAVPFQPAEELSNVLGSSDLLVVLLEPDASRFSVPSKVLTYLSAGRPVLGLMPTSNDASAAVLATGGFVAEPTPDGVAAAAAWAAELLTDRPRLLALGIGARTYADTNFNGATASASLSEVIASATQRSPA